MEKITYAGWPNCYRIANEQIELVVTADVGPRIIRLAFLGGENEFQNMPDQVGKVGDDEWRIYGGHRLWHSPESKPRSYFPDNHPVAVTVDGDCVRFTPPPEVPAGFQKEIEVRLVPGEARATITHRLRNISMWPIEAAPWAISVMAPGGVGIVPQSTTPVPGNLLPNRVLVVWPYTQWNDHRLTIGEGTITLKQDATPRPAKIGLNVDGGWCAYARGGHVFLKRFEYFTGMTYPDFGASVEMYSCDRFLELETLGPLRRLQPGATAEHVEQWQLFRGIEITDEESINRGIRPLL